MSDWLLALTFHIIAILIIVAEIFIPSMGVLSIIALGFMGYALSLVFNAFPVSVFYAVLGADLVILPIMFILGFKVLEVSPLSLRTRLSASRGVTAHDPELKNYLNSTGHSLSPLRPSGSALIDDVRLDVVTDGEFIEADVPVRVCRVAGNQVVVCQRENIEQNT